MIGARLFGAILMAGGLVASGTFRGRTGNYWQTGSNRFGMNGEQHDPDRVLRAEAKRIQRRAKVRRAVAAGGYGLTPYVGQKYTPNTRCGVKSLQARGLVDKAVG